MSDEELRKKCETVRRQLCDYSFTSRGLIDDKIKQDEAALLRFARAVQAETWRALEEKLYEYPSHDELVHWCESQARASEEEEGG